MSELANNKSIRKEVNDLGETLGITPKGKNNQQKIRSIGEQASDGTYATKEYVNTLMSGALKRQIVEALPQTNIDTNTIYMVLDQEASQPGNVYNEYLYINENWELIGTTSTSSIFIDLDTVEEITLDEYNQIMDKMVRLDYESRELFFSYFNAGNPIFTSTVYDNKYLQVTFTYHEDIEGDYYTFEVETISIGGGEGIEYVELNSASGTIEDETFQKLDFGGAYIKYNDIVLIPNGREQSGGGLGGTKTCYFDSTVNNNKYLSCVLTASLPLPPNATVPYTITEISVGGGIEYVELSYNSGFGGTITQAQAILLTNGAWVKMNDLAPYSLPMLPSMHAPADGLLHFATALETTGRGEIYFREIIVDTQNLSYTVADHQIEPHQAQPEE